MTFREGLAVFLGLDILEERSAGREPPHGAFNLIDPHAEKLLAVILRIDAHSLEQFPSV